MSVAVIVQQKYRRAWVNVHLIGPFESVSDANQWTIDNKERYVERPTVFQICDFMMRG